MLVLITILLTLSSTNQVSLVCLATTLWSETASAQWSVASRNETVHTSCAEKQNYAFRSEKQKQPDVVVFLLLQCFSSFTSCDEPQRLFHRDEGNQ